MWRRAPCAQLILWIKVFGGVVLPAHASLWGPSIRCMGEMSSSPDMCFAWAGRFSKKRVGFLAPSTTELLGKKHLREGSAAAQLTRKPVGVPA